VLPPLAPIGRPQRNQEQSKRRKATGRLKLTCDLPSE
jgi:hypothetical protein